MRTVGIVLLIIGIVGLAIFGVQAIQDTETFSFLGIDIGVSSANWTPVIVSAGFVLGGVVAMNSNRRTFSN